MKRKPRGLKSRYRSIQNRCMFCEGLENLSTITHEDKDSRGRATKNQYCYHEDCLSKAVDRGDASAIEIIKKMQETEAVMKKQKEASEKEKASAKAWWQKRKDKYVKHPKKN